MPVLHISPDLAEAVPALKADNNTWRGSYRGTDTVIVFVHGVLSSALACWHNKEAGVYWPDMVVKDRAFKSSSVFLGGYYTAFDSTDFGLDDCAEYLFAALARKDSKEGVPAVIEHSRIIFVCHSLGGIVTRYMLFDRQRRFYDKKIGLVLIASPSLGSAYANIAGNPIKLLRHQIGRQLAWRSETLDTLDRQFNRLKNDKVIPEMIGKELCEHRFVVYRRWLGPLNNLFPRIVSESSAGRYWPPAVKIPDSDHSSIVKPNSERHDSHLRLRDFYRDFQNAFPPASVPVVQPPAEVDTGPAAPRPEPLMELHCARLLWDASITEDGDANNETTFEGISRAGAGAENGFPIESWVEWGHTSRFEIDVARSSSDATLREHKMLPRHIQQFVVFETRPSPTQPRTVVLRSIDFNVYSMDSTEFQRKKTEKSEDFDYFQKTVRWESYGELTIVVHFPEAMRLRGNMPISVRAYQLVERGSDPERLEVYDEALTDEAAKRFVYDPVKREATLQVANPAPWTAYRIFWRLAPPEAAAPAAAKMALLSTNRAALLSIRPLFECAPTPSGLEKKKLVLTALARFGALAIAEVNRCLDALQSGTKASIDVSQLDLSLMAVATSPDPMEHEELQVVAGLLKIPAYWETKLSIGDGIAGRAAKRVQPRKYYRSAEPSRQNDAYMALDDGRSSTQHQWLLCVPLHEECCGHYPYGVVNIGALDRRNAILLNAIDEQSIGVLDRFANGEFLKSLLEATK
jgi:hypothetical protein